MPINPTSARPMSIEPMSTKQWPTRLTLYSDLPDREAMLIDTFNSTNTRCEVNRIGLANVSCRVSTGSHLLLLDFVRADKHELNCLRHLRGRIAATDVPLLLMTNPCTEDLLEGDAIDGVEPLSYSPFSLPGLAFNLRNESRALFLRRIGRLYEYGTLAVRLPQAALCRDKRRYRATA